MRPKSALDLVTAAHTAGGRSWHIGVLVPWANTVVEAELPQLRPAGVVFHYARLVPPDQSTALDDGFLDGLRAAVPSALASMSRLPLDTVLLACTSAGFTHVGPRPEGVVSAFEALTAALRSLGVGRIALATPYPQALTTAQATALTSSGIAVTAHASLGHDDGYAQLTSTQIHALVKGIDPAALGDAEALVLSCTGWPTLDVIPELEADLGMPVLSSNLAMVAHVAALTDHKSTRG